MNFRDFPYELIAFRLRYCAKDCSQNVYRKKLTLGNIVFL